MFPVNSPRKVGREAIRQSVPSDLWVANEEFSRALLKAVENHPINRHPFIEQLEKATPDFAAQRFFHLEFRHAFAQVFTDVVIQAMSTSAQLEERLGALGKVAARFLLQLNLLDELGFQPQATESDYAGNPYLSHYLQFDSTLKQLRITSEELLQFKPSAAADACRRSFTSNYGDHCLLTCALAISETVFRQFAGPWAKSVGKRTGIDVSHGYHSIHIEQEGKFIDDDHSEDAWYVFRQAVTPDRFDDVRIKSQEWLDAWMAFLDYLSAAASSHQRTSAPADSRGELVGAAESLSSAPSS